MNKNTRLFYGAPVGHSFGMGLKLESLHKDLMRMRPDTALYQCPSFLDYIKNMYLVRSPANLLVKKHNDLWVVLLRTSDGLIKIDDDEHNPNVTQIMNDRWLRMISEDDCNVEILPPFLHKQDKFYGVAGKMNVHKWFRTVSVATISHEFEVNEGDPLVYLKFDRTVKPVLVTMPPIADDIENVNLGIKGLLPMKPLKKLYNMFTSTKRNKLLIDAIKEYNNIQ